MEILIFFAVFMVFWGLGILFVYLLKRRDKKISENIRFKPLFSTKRILKHLSSVFWRVFFITSLCFLIVIFIIPETTTYMDCSGGICVEKVMMVREILLHFLYAIPAFLGFVFSVKLSSKVFIENGG
ncbi:hypothetical protein M0R19_09395 [Candidatus Pacearchaeota archaeon]|nr:hypothetical protein [Candidatus Pacearchaeota archaeon]